MPGMTPVRRPRRWRWAGRSLAVLGFSLLAACHGQKKRESGSSFAPLAAASWLVPLEVPGFGPALAAVPLGARAPRPLLIAVHGDHDRPEWTCGSYRHVISSRAFILCPRGPAQADVFGLGAS